MREDILRFVLSRRVVTIPMLQWEFKIPYKNAKEFLEELNNDGQLTVCDDCSYKVVANYDGEEKANDKNRILQSTLDFFKSALYFSIISGRADYEDIAKKFSVHPTIAYKAFRWMHLRGLTVSSLTADDYKKHIGEPKEFVYKHFSQRYPEALMFCISCNKISVNELSKYFFASATEIRDFINWAKSRGYVSLGCDCKLKLTEAECVAEFGKECELHWAEDDVSEFTFSQTNQQSSTGEDVSGGSCELDDDYEYDYYDDDDCEEDDDDEIYDVLKEINNAINEAESSEDIRKTMISLISDEDSSDNDTDDETERCSYGKNIEVAVIRIMEKIGKINVYKNVCKTEDDFKMTYPAMTEKIKNLCYRVLLFYIKYPHAALCDMMSTFNLSRAYAHAIVFWLCKLKYLRIEPYLTTAVKEDEFADKFGEVDIGAEVCLLSEDSNKIDFSVYDEEFTDICAAALWHCIRYRQISILDLKKNVTHDFNLAYEIVDWMKKKSYVSYGRVNIGIIGFYSEYGKATFEYIKALHELGRPQELISTLFDETDYVSKPLMNLKLDFARNSLKKAFFTVETDVPYELRIVTEIGKELDVKLYSDGVSIFLCTGYRVEKRELDDKIKTIIAAYDYIFYVDGELFAEFIDPNFTVTAFTSLFSALERITALHNNSN